MHSAAVHTEEHHPDARQYMVIAVILSVITAVEVGIYYLPAVRPVLPPALIVLSAIKFSLVVMYYMHLKFDNRVFTAMFVFGLATAAFTIISFLALFGYVQLGGHA